MYSSYCYIMQKMNTCEFNSIAWYGNLNQSQVLIDIQQLWTTRECDFLDILFISLFELVHYFIILILLCYSLLLHEEKILMIPKW